jgi:hypothetical protein
MLGGFLAIARSHRHAASGSPGLGVPARPGTHPMRDAMILVLGTPILAAALLIVVPWVLGMVSIIDRL